MKPTLIPTTGTVFVKPTTSTAKCHYQNLMFHSETQEVEYQEFEIVAVGPGVDLHAGDSVFAHPQSGYTLKVGDDTYRAIQLVNTLAAFKRG